MSSTFPGPAALGRGAIVLPGSDVPPTLIDVPRVRVDETTLDAPEQVVTHLHERWLARDPVLIELAVNPRHLRAVAAETTTVPLSELGPGFTLWRERLHFLVWANNWDLREGTPVWWWGRKAIAAGATASDGAADVLLPDGSPAWCDGGPLGDLRAVDGVAVVHRTAIERGSLRFPDPGATSSADLAPDQRAAVEHGTGPARIIAPAGSGKTRVLTERLRHLLRDRQVHPDVLLAVAYNTRAAEELQERAAGLGARIRTLNSLGLAIDNGTGGIARSALEPDRRQMLDERGVRNLLDSLVELPRRSNTDPYAPWIDALSMARLGLRPPEEIETLVPDVTGFADVLVRYRTTLEQRRLLDFDEQIFRAAEILLSDAVARTHAQQRCRMLLVDEFQDLTPAHLLMLRTLASPGLDVFGVGDDDQVVYGYAGADPRFLVEFGTWFPGAAHHPLQVNYRCPPQVVTAAGNLLSRNRVRVAKEIDPAPGRVGAADDLTVRRAPSADLATEALAAVRGWIDDGEAPSSIAVLTRVNVALLPAQVVLSEAGVPTTAPVGTELLGRTGIRAALAYLRMGVDPRDIAPSDVLLTVRRPSRKIARNVVEMMTTRRRTSIDDLAGLARALTGSDSERVRSYVDDLRAVTAACERGTAEALGVIRSHIGLGRAMDALDSSRREADRSTHADDLAALEAVAHLHPEAATFEPWLTAALERSGASDGVHLSTIHRVKGREWDRVVVHDVSDGLVPHRLANDLAEERRVLHVAITRCRQSVVVTADARNPSPFLRQLDRPGDPDPEPVPAPSRPATVARAATKAAPALPTVAAAVGAVLVTGGFEGKIVEVTGTGVIISPGGTARLSVPFGTEVRCGTESGVLVDPAAKARAAALGDALRRWRSQVAKESKVPAYTVLHDAHLDGIADAVPGSIEELSRCKGVGPAKLDRWGDEILAVVAASTET